MKHKIIQGETLSLKVTFLVDGKSTPFDNAKCQLINQAKEIVYTSLLLNDSLLIPSQITQDLLGYYALRITVSKAELISKQDIFLEVTR